MSVRKNGGRSLSFLERLVNFNQGEKEYFGYLLERIKNRMDTSKRQKIKEMLTIQKATKAGITVSEEEIEKEITRIKEQRKFKNLEKKNR